MYKIVKWTPALDLTNFYAEAERRGFVNNATQKMLVDSISNEREWCVWILYYNDTAVGTVGAHTLDMIPNAVRICVRTCAFTDMLPTPSLRTRVGITSHQHVTAQFFMPVCIDWAGDRDMYITSHPSEVGTQRLVHTVWGPTLAMTGVLQQGEELEYRGHKQTFWKLNKDIFLEQLNKEPRWTQ
jgi:hypothetical protein